MASKKKPAEAEVETGIAIPAFEEFKEKVLGYHAWCDSKNLIPSLADMAGRLGYTKSEINSFADQKVNPKGYRDFQRLLEMSKDRREARLLDRMVSEPRYAQGCLNALKQAENGGYSDRPVDNAEKKLTVNVSGVGGEESFK